MANDDIPENYDALLAGIDEEIARHESLAAAAQGKLAALNVEQDALGHHPNYVAYCHGGIPAVPGMGAGHILAHAGFYRLPYAQAIMRLAEARIEADEDCLIVALKRVCESDAMLEVAGLAWLDQYAVLKRGALNPIWLKRPKLGLGQPAKLHGLEAADAEAHRGLYTLPPDDLRRRFDAVAVCAANTFGDVLTAVIAAGGTEFAAIGKAATEMGAAGRYWAKCASFAAHQRACGDRRWRWKPPLSRQGHHARTIAELKDLEMPAERTRGHSATWLNDNGANPRFRKD